MGTDIASVIEDANALMEHIKYYMVCHDRKSAHVQRLVQLADELVQELCIEQEEAAK